MRILGKKWLALTAVIPVAALIACSSDAPVQVLTPSGQVYDEDEYNELVEAGMVDEMGNVIEEDEDEAGSDTDKSSTSKTGTSSSSAKGTSGDANSSAGGDKATSSSAGDKATSSSSGEKATSSSGTESPASSGTAPASSATPASNSSAPASSATPASSSSVAASSSATVTSSGSNTDQHENTGCDSGECSIGSNVMDEVDAETKTELDSLKDLLDNGGAPAGFEELPEGLTGETFNYNFLGENDVYCFTGEGEWLHVDRSELGEYINHFKNGAAWGQLAKFEIIFSDLCAEVYFRRKS